MKKIILYTIIVLLAFTSCQKDFLDEKPQDFLGSANAYQNYNGLNATINNLYWFTRRVFFNRDESRPFDFLYGTDLIFDGEQSTNRHSNMIAAYDPTSGIPATHWDNLYTMVVESNLVISRAPDADLTDEEYNDVMAQAYFFRAFAYRTLVYLFDRVPLVLEEISTPRTDFVRASKEEVLNQVIEDLRYAAENLPGITQVKDGKLSNLAARHLLAEVYIAAGLPQEAVDAATVVIDDPATGLMKSRFGSRSGEPGDVYWDLFRKNNQNRASGNTEGIWVVQFETDVIGGGSVSGGKDGSFALERHHVPFLRDTKVNGVNLFIWPVSGYTGGRGIGWGISTKYFSDDIWEGDFDNDIRNSKYNFVREFLVTNPNSPLYGDTISTQNPPEGLQVPSRPFYAYQSKATTPFNHPDGLYADKDTYLLNNSAGATYTDQYMFRLAETYLLRAEAYMDLGNNTKAAEDINVVRSRAHANPVAPGDVDIDYILDERMRELGVEEKRRLTLMRLGLLYDRVKAHNPYYADEILPKYNLWPIPAEEIERNIDADLEQNPGYN